MRDGKGIVVMVGFSGAGFVLWFLDGRWLEECIEGSALHCYRSELFDLSERLSMIANASNDTFPHKSSSDHEHCGVRCHRAFAMIDDRVSDIQSSELLGC